MDCRVKPGNDDAGYGDPESQTTCGSIGELIDAALPTQPIDPVVTAPDRRKCFRVINGEKF